MAYQQTYRRTGSWLAAVALAAACASAAVPAPEPSVPDRMGDERPTVAPAGSVFGISKPSKESKLAFAGPGIVIEVPAKQGDVVKSGQVLAKQDNRADTFALQSMEAEAKSQDKVEYSKDDLAEKQLQAKRKHEMYDKKVATLTEMEEADLAVKLAEAQLALAKLEHEQKGYEASKQQDKLDHEVLKSPVDGVVKKLNVSEGEMADPQNREGAIVVAAWDPLWIEANPSTADARDLKVGQTLQAHFDGDPEDKWQAAKIVFLDQFDFGSESRLVRLELPNPTQMPPGLRVTVKLPARSPNH